MLQIKICGITRRHDAQFCASLGVDAVGMIFYAGSPRAVTPGQASEIRDQLPESTRLIGVFVNEEAAVVRAKYEAYGLDAVQLHGQEDEAYSSELGIPHIKALAIRPGLDSDDLLNSYPDAEALLIDSLQNGKFGGTGSSIDFSLFPQNPGRPVYLAGGLGIDNISEAIRAASPYGVDASSKLELSPGVKNHDLVETFVELARDAAGSLNLPNQG